MFELINRTESIKGLVSDLNDNALAWGSRGKEVDIPGAPLGAWGYAVYRCRSISNAYCNPLWVYYPRGRASRRTAAPVIRRGATVRGYAIDQGSPEDGMNSIEFIDRVRKSGILSLADWNRIRKWKGPILEAFVVETPMPVLDSASDTRTWAKVVAARRLIGYEVPRWAALWLWRLGGKRSKKTFWGKVSKVAERMGMKQLGIR